MKVRLDWDSDPEVVTPCFLIHFILLLVLTYSLFYITSAQFWNLFRNFYFTMQYKRKKQINIELLLIYKVLLKEENLNTNNFKEHET